MSFFTFSLMTRNGRALLAMLVVGGPLALGAMGIFPSFQNELEHRASISAAPSFGVKLVDGSILTAQDPTFPHISLSPGVLFTLVFTDEKGNEITPPTGTPGEFLLNDETVLIGRPHRAPSQNSGLRLRTLHPHSPRSTLIITFVVPESPGQNEGFELANLIE